jgi:hypothetical protein
MGTPLLTLQNSGCQYALGRPPFSGLRRAIVAKNKQTKQVSFNHAFF